MPLDAWHAVQGRTEFRNLLLGNGASCAVSPRFGYATLYRVAEQRGLLQPEDVALFQQFGTTNFEGILVHLSNARRVLESLGSATNVLRERYASVARTLGRAVAATHVRWVDCETKLESLGNALGAFQRVFSTNYDLLAYWSIMRVGEAVGFRDLFFDGNTFNPRNIVVQAGRPSLMFLHGAIHLRQTADGLTRKRAQQGATLLEQFEADAVAHPNEVPLIITGGNAGEKLRAIRSSDYLNHCYDLLGQEGSGLCVFGHSFSDVDQHITDRICANDNITDVAVSIYVRGVAPVVVDERVATVRRQLEGKQVHCFDSSTHPLGDQALAVND